MVEIRGVETRVYMARCPGFNPSHLQFFWPGYITCLSGVLWLSFTQIHKDEKDNALHCNYPLIRMCVT